MDIRHYDGFDSDGKVKWIYVSPDEARANGRMQSAGLTQGENVSEGVNEVECKPYEIYCQKNNDSTLKTAVICQFIYSVLALIFGFFSIIIGATLSLNGISGEVTWSVEIIGLKSNLDSAPQGVVLCLIGFFIMWVGRFSIHINKGKSNKSSKRDAASGSPS